MVLLALPAVAQDLTKSGVPGSMNDKQYEAKLYAVHEMQLKRRIGELERKVTGMQKCITELYSRVIKLEKVK